MAAQGRREKDVSIAKKGMNRDSHPSTLQGEEYSFALNSNYEHSDGQGIIMLQNEPSNLLCNRFPEGMQVVGITPDRTSDVTYFFLTNPETGCSEIGYIPHINDIVNVEDITQVDCKCDINVILADALENQTPVETCTYTTLINDCSCPEFDGEGNKCLNFDINYPISTELKDEKCGKVIYFTDDLNPIRRIEVDNIEQYFINTVQCEEEEECGECNEKDVKVCIDCEKLLVFKNYSTPCIEFQGLVTGGSLRHGLYTFYIAYTDDNGNEMSRYMALTGTIPVKDPNKQIYAQPELDAITNYSIKLKINNLDPRYRFYKIVSKQITSVDGAVSWFEAGVFPTSNDTVIYSSDANLQRAVRDFVTGLYPVYTKAKNVTSANNMLFLSDLEAQTEINLQPVVNLMGQFAKWRTVMLEEDAFALAENNEKYRTYYRDEVYPFSIRFFTNNGYTTANFPLISRAATNNDLYFDNIHQADPAGVISTLVAGEPPSTNTWRKDVYSILRYGNKNCTGAERIYKWQYYNTGSFTKSLNDLDCTEVSFTERLENISNFCTTDVEEVFVEDLDIVVDNPPQGESYSSLLDYINSLTPAQRETFFVTYPQLDPEDIDIPCCLDGEEISVITTPILGDFVDGTYNGVSGTTSGSGTGAIFNVVITGGDTATITLVDGGVGYEVGDTITIDGTDLGGSTDDLTITVQEVKDRALSLFCYGDTCNCSNVQFTSSFTNIVDIDESELEQKVIFFDCEDYRVDRAPEFCEPYKVGFDGEYENINPCQEDEEPEVGETACFDGKCKFNYNWEYSGFIGLANNSGTATNKKNWIFERVSSFIGSLDPSSPDVLSLNSQSVFGGAHISPVFPDFEIDGEDSDTCVGGIDYCDAIKNEADLITDVDSCPKGENTSLVKQIKKKFCRSNNFTAEGYFKDKLHTNALYFEVDFQNNDEIILNVSRTTKPPSSNSKKDCLQYAQEMRVSLYNGTVSSANYKGAYFVGKNGKVLCEESDCESLTGIKKADFPSGKVVIAIDTPIVLISDTTVNDRRFPCSEAKYLSPTEGCFNISASSPRVKSIEFKGDVTISVQKTCEYTADCMIRMYDEIKCEAIPWEEGKFAYWESTQTYPNNNFLYNSQPLKVKESLLPNSILEAFKEVFEDETVEGVIHLNDNANFACKPIRHFKFPDVAVSPITDGIAETSLNAPFKSNRIFPIGIHLDNEIINAFLDVAVDNGLITQEFRDNIQGYEIFKGDVSLNRSIIAKGLSYDMFNYFETKEQESRNTPTWFANFPYNDLGDNQLIYTDSQRKNFLKHPFNGTKNIKFSFISPETLFERPTVPFEMKVEGYMLGRSRGRFSEVRRHPNMVILGRRAYTWAAVLGTVEATLTLTTSIVNSLMQTSLALSSFPPVGAGLAWTAFALQVAQSTSYFLQVDVNQRIYEWLKIFDNNGTPYNFASYYSSLGYYNSISKRIFEGNIVRGIRDKRYLFDGRYRFRELFEDVQVNNYLRESSLYLSVDENTSNPPLALSHPTRFTNFDNSRTFASQAGLCGQEDEDTKVTPEFERRIYAPYVSLKDYVPDQYGALDAVNWITTSYCGYLDLDNKCDTVFGGNIFLSRFYMKRKFSFFNNAMIDGMNSLADFTPFDYYQQRNIGFPRFYLNYKTDNAVTVGAFDFPTIRSFFNLDCQFEKRMYVKPPSKFYLWYYGIPSYITESQINLNYRYGSNDTDEDFFPNQNDYIEWTQERNVSIRRDNHYAYNPTYSRQNGSYAWRILPFNYNPEEWDCRFDHWDRVIYSEMGAAASGESVTFVEGWTVFRANNLYDFGNKYGTLYMLKNIESQKVFGLFENGAVVFNAFNTIQGSIEDIQVGTGGVFAQRPTEYFRTELGYGGTQNRVFVSCEFGHFWVDAKRGKIHSMQSGGGGVDEISRNGMKNWFRENLPFQIVKDFPEISSDMLDNVYKGIGITMVWDARYSRLFVTKKDVRLKPQYKGRIQIEGLDFIDTENENEIVLPTNEIFFTDVSWTVAYNPLTKSWVSYYSFTPNYYVAHNNYFQSGLNYGDGKGIWSHLLTNKSFQVFYGQIFPWKIEIPLKNSLDKKWYESIEYKLDVKRYANEYDFGYREANFNKATIFNNRENSGQLNLITAVKNNMYQQTQYPRYNATSWDILATNNDQTWNFNTFYDVVRDNHQLPVWNNTPNNVDKTLNNAALNYNPTYKNRLRGQWATVLLTQDKESRLKYIFEYLINTHAKHI
jgi:hypothetical protein